MTQDEMMDYCRKMLFALQKVRSNEKWAFDIMQISGQVREAIFEDILKWTSGSHGTLTLKGLQAVLDRSYVKPIEFYNFMTIAHRFGDGLIVLWLQMTNNITLPEPDISWLNKSAGDK